MSGEVICTAEDVRRIVAEVSRVDGRELVVRTVGGELRLRTERVGSWLNLRESARLLGCSEPTARARIAHLRRAGRGVRCYRREDVIAFRDDFALRRGAAPRRKRGGAA